MKNKQFTGSLPAKVAAYFLLVISACLLVSCVIGAIYIGEADCYTKSKNQLLREDIYELARADGRTALLSALGKDDQLTAYESETNFKYEIFDAAGVKVSGNYEKFLTALSFDFTYGQDKITDGYMVKVYINDQFPVSDRYAAINKLVGTAYALRYSIYFIGLLALVLSIISFIFLMCSAGHKTGQEGIVASGLVKLPFDLLTALLLFAVYAVGSVYYNDVLYSQSDAVNVITAIIGFVLGIIITTAYCMNFAVRVKSEDWWKNTISIAFWGFCCACAKRFGAA